MSRFYQNKESQIMYRLWTRSENEFEVFKQTVKSYFDGLWEYETHEESLGVFQSEDAAFDVMI